MRNAAFPLLADCLRPGFARHLALSRAPRSWRTEAYASQRRHNTAEALQTAPDGLSDASPSNLEVSDDSTSQSAGEKPVWLGDERVARWQKTQERLADSDPNTPWKLRHWQNVEERLARNKAEHAHSTERERELWYKHSPTPRSWLWQEKTASSKVSQQLLKDLPIAALYERMRFAAGRGETAYVSRLAAYLLRERGEEPNTKMYSCLILSHCSAINGSAQWVRSLLEEMKAEGIEIDRGICHDVLKALAVHPEHLLRADILEYMRSRWFTVSEEGQHDIAASLLREGQLELGTEAIETMERQGMDVQEWLYDVALHILCDTGEIDEALRLLRSRITTRSASAREVTPILWWRLLESASSSLHYEGTKYVWVRRVQQGFLNPASGICLNVLKVAARIGDTDLAQSVFQLLGERGTVFEDEHYELLMESYITAKDMKQAFTLLCIMHDTNARPDLGTVRGLVYHLRVSESARRKAHATLGKLGKERAVPAVAMNALIEAAVAANHLDEAVEYYKSMHSICAKPSRNVDTFNCLLRGCRSADRKDTAMFVASEMVALSVKPDALTYDRLVLVCLKETDFEDAFRYYFEMSAQGLKPRLGTLFFLAKKSANAADSRTARLLEDMDSFGPVAQRPKQMIESSWRRAQDGLLSSAEGQAAGNADAALSVT